MTPRNGWERRIPEPDMPTTIMRGTLTASGFEPSGDWEPLTPEPAEET